MNLFTIFSLLLASPILTHAHIASNTFPPHSTHPELVARQSGRQNSSSTIAGACGCEWGDSNDFGESSGSPLTFNGTCTVGSMAVLLSDPYVLDEQTWPSDWLPGTCCGTSCTVDCFFAYFGVDDLFKRWSSPRWSMRPTYRCRRKSIDWRRRNLSYHSTDSHI